MMKKELEHLLRVFDYKVFELCGPFQNGDDTDYYVPYMMNDAVEDYLILHNCKMVGKYIPNLELNQKAQVAEDENGYVLAVRQGEENAFTLYFERIEEKIQCYQYHRIGHFWVKGQEQWRQLVYMIGTIHDKYTFLGEAFCNEEEKVLLKLAEFTPLRRWSPIHDSLDESYVETEAGILAMKKVALEAGDQSYVRWITCYQYFPWLRTILSKKLLSPKREVLYQFLYRKISEASKKYPERLYNAEMMEHIEKMRNEAQRELLSRGFKGTYPIFEKENQGILVTEELPFTVLEWNHYKFRVSFMVSECSLANEIQLNSGFFHGRGRKGWIETYDKF